MKRDPPPRFPDPHNSATSPTPEMGSKSDDNTAAYTSADGGGMDELLAVLGYKVKSTDMSDVASKLEQLAHVMSSVDQPCLSQLASDTVHYNPSDLSTWLESMISELNPASDDVDPSNNHIVADPFSDSDLQAIPGMSVLSPPPPPPPPPQCFSSDSNSVVTGTTLSSPRNAKKIKLEKGSSCEGSNTRPIVVVDSQENGIRLVHTLMACAEAIQQHNMSLAVALVKQIGFLASSQIGSMRKVATYFAEALARRVYKLRSNNSPFDDNLSQTLEMHFFDACPYIKFAHFTANQVILEAFSGKKRVHVIDLSMKHGLQWPALMQALAVRSEGPPLFRLTGIGPPAPDNSDQLQEVGWKLAKFAESVGIKFQYRGFVAKCLTDLEYGLLDLKPDSEVVAVNSVFELHKLLAKQGGIDKVLGLIKKINPVVFTVVEQEANHNGPVFLERFNESLHYYSTLFDSLESCTDSENKGMSEVFLGKQICNVVACEGVDRFERHESLVQWKTRFGSYGFDPVHLGSNVFKQASMLLDYFAGGNGYGVEERDGCLMLGWHSRPLITTSAWQLRDNSGSRS